MAFFRDVIMIPDNVPWVFKACRVGQFTAARHGAAFAGATGWDFQPAICLFMSTHVPPTIRTRVSLKTAAEGGRCRPFCEGYCPHFVVDDGELLGVRLIHCPTLVAPGDERELEFELIYHARVDYSRLVAGATFKIVEGRNTIGTGVVIG